MLLRFSLYGFLKNQRYFEAFWILAFLEKDLSFFAIGTLFGFRELAANLMEIPSGAVADLWGRKRAMILSFGAMPPVNRHSLRQVHRAAPEDSPSLKFLLALPGFVAKVGAHATRYPPSGLARGGSSVGESQDALCPWDPG